MTGARFVAVLFCLSPLTALAQPRVDPRNLYERAMCVAPMTGAGTLADPKRPLHVPLPSAVSAASRTRTGILGFTHVMGDDGTALVEYVARDRSAFTPLLADPQLKCFVKGVHKRADLEAEFKKHKKDFDFNNFGVRLP